MKFFLKKNIISAQKLKSVNFKFFILSVMFFFTILAISSIFNKDKNYYISHSDFKFPISSDLYILKHFYIWSDQTGTLNLDGVLRFFVRIPNFISFILFNNNVSASYAYIILTLVFAFFSFFYFAENTLKINSLILKILFSFFFAINPAYLGNMSKIGLVLSSSVLPLIISVTEKMFKNEKFHLLLLLAFLLDISFIHPFTLFVNLVIFLFFLSFKVFENFDIVKKNIKQIAIYSVLSVVSNSFIIFPMFFVRTIDKESIGTQIGISGSENLISVSRAKTLFEAFSFSKSSFIDFSFYNEKYKPLFFLSMISLYILIVYGFFRNRKSLEKSKKIIYSMFGFFILLIILSLGNGNILSETFNLILIRSPISWFFRSPLKWQLYLPFSLFSIGIVVLSKFKTFFENYWSKILLTLIIFVSNFYVGYQVFKNLLKPKKIDAFYNLSKIDLSQKKAVLVNDESCRDFARESRENYDTLTFLLSSGSNLFQNLSDEKLFGNKILYKNFDYIFTCKRDFSMVTDEDFYELEVSKKFNVYAYQNIKKEPDVFVTDSLYSVPDIDSSNNIYNFLQNYLGENANIVFKSQKDKVGEEIKLTKSFELFSTLKKDNLKSNEQKLVYPIFNDKVETYNLYNTRNLIEVEYNLIKGKNSDEIILTGYIPEISVTGGIFFSKEKIFEKELFFKKQENFFLQFDENGSIFKLNEGEHNIGIVENFDKIRIFGSDENLVDNGSFEDGVWKDVCENSFIGLTISSDEKTDGEYALKMETRKSSACVKRTISVSSLENYILSVDTKTINEQDSVFRIEFDDKKKTTIEKKLTSDQEFRTNLFNFKIPLGSKEAKLIFIGRPIRGNKQSFLYFDNINFYKSNLLFESTKSEILNEKFFYIKNLSTPPFAEFSIKTSGYKFQNLIENGSFEGGMWRDSVEDCFNYDNRPEIEMKINEFGTDGKKSLQLDAKRHIACSTKVVDLNRSKNIFFSFDYKGYNAKFAGYSLTFDNPSRSFISERLEIKNNNWNNFSKIIDVPSGVTKATLKIYAYQTDRIEKNSVFYDNFFIAKLPALFGTTFLIQESEKNENPVKSVNLENIDPTKLIVSLKSAKGSFFIIVNKDYSKWWRAYMKNNNENFLSKIKDIFPNNSENFVPENYHISSNIKLNTWYFDVDKFCFRNSNGCKKNHDGTYDITMYVEFWPQRYFYVGLIFSFLVYIPIFIIFTIKFLIIRQNKVPIYLKREN